MRFSGFDDEWKTYKLKDLLHNKSSSISINQLDDNVGNYPLYGASGFLKCIDFYEMDSDYISIVKDGSGVGNISFHEKNTSVVNTSQYILPKENLNIHFIFYLLQTINLNKYKTGSTIPHIYFKDYSIEKVKIPKYDEQKKIGILLKNLDAKIEILDNKLQMCQNFKKYLMQQIFTQKLRFDFNDEWKNIPFKKLLKEVNEKTTVNNQHEILSSTKEGIFTQKDYFADRNVASKDNTGYKVLRKNQIVLSPQNLWMGNINVNTEFDIGIVSPSYKIYETTDLIDINYFKHIVKLPRLIYEYTCASEQGASIVRRNLNKQLFNEITIKVPSLNEQKKIGNLFDTCDEKIKNIDKNIQDMKEFKKGLLQQMFVVRINWRCNFKLAKSPSFNKHLLILKNKIIFIIIK